MSVEQCSRHSFGSERACILEAGHDGPHRVFWPNGTAYEWTDEQTEAAIAKYSSRFD